MYRNTLQSLYEKNQPGLTVQAMKQLIPHLAGDAAGVVEVNERLYFHSRVIEHNYAQTLELIKTLDTVLR